MLKLIVQPTHRTIGLGIVTQTSSIPDVIRALGRRDFIPAKNISKSQINGSTKQLVVALGKVVKHPDQGYDSYLGTNHKNEYHYVPVGQALVTDTVVAIAPLEKRK